MKHSNKLKAFACSALVAFSGLLTSCRTVVYTDQFGNRTSTTRIDTDACIGVGVLAAGIGMLALGTAAVIDSCHRPHHHNVYVAPAPLPPPHRCVPRNVIRHTPTAGTLLGNTVKGHTHYYREY